ncbi:MAG TPA: alpha/beta fold hydrolase [Anaerolineales bacterium]|nr:alpha/beta fold hydrolase [Anaerolineales bacterium]
MKKQVLFIQGGGKGAYEEDEKLADSLHNALGAEYHVSYPQMPNEESPEDRPWISQISMELDSLEDNVILVGHSAGGAVLLKYLLKENVSKNFAGIFLISIPFWEPEDEEDTEYTLQEGFASKLPTGVPIFLYHSRDDEWVPFAHLAWYAERIPQATVREFDGRGHQFNNDLSEVAADIKSL